MITNLNVIVKEWAYRVHDGKPNPNNHAHLYQLSEILIENKWSLSVIDELLQNLSEGDEWWTKLSPEQQAQYIKDHPKSKKAQDAKEKEKDSDAKEKRVINDKNKTLKKVDTSKSETYVEDIDPSEETFKNNLEIGEPPPEFKISEELDTGKFPKKYVKLIERMMNSKRVGTKPEISTLISSGGAGAISAQAGEVLTLMASSMSDEEWDNLQSTMLEHEKKTIEENPDLKAPGKRVINKSWIVAAGKSRKAIRDRISKKYGEGVEIVNTGWDTEQDVTAMGWDDYSGQKGFSTDIYIKVRTSDGEEIMDEVSLKKDTKINFLNSQTGQFRKWDSDTVGSSVDSKVYARKERVSLNNAIKEFGLDLPEPTSRKSAKVVWKTMLDRAPNVYNTNTGKVTLSDPPTKEELWIKSHIDQIREYTTDATRAIVDNPKLKAGMLQDIRKEFPLKSVGEGEETMAIGDLSLDPDTMKELFGTSDFELIKEHLVINESVDPPALAYQAESGGDMIDIASIVIRQDGIGYGSSSMKFEMQMDKGFAKKLRESHEKVYGEI